MAFRQKVKSALVVGNQASVILGGMEYSGEVVEFETMSPQDAHVSLKQEDGSIYVIPVSSQMVVVIPPAEAEEEKVEEAGEEEKVETKQPPIPPKGKGGKTQTKK